MSKDIPCDKADQLGKDEESTSKTIFYTFLACHQHSATCPNGEVVNGWYPVAETVQIRGGPSRSRARLDRKSKSLRAEEKSPVPKKPRRKIRRRPISETSEDELATDSSSSGEETIPEQSMKASKTASPSPPTSEPPPYEAHAPVDLLPKEQVNRTSKQQPQASSEQVPRTLKRAATAQDDPPTRTKRRANSPEKIGPPHRQPSPGGPSSSVAILPPFSTLDLPPSEVYHGDGAWQHQRPLLAPERPRVSFAWPHRTPSRTVSKEAGLASRRPRNIREMLPTIEAALPSSTTPASASAAQTASSLRSRPMEAHLPRTPSKSSNGRVSVTKAPSTSSTEEILLDTEAFLSSILWPASTRILNERSVNDGLLKHQIAAAFLQTTRGQSYIRSANDRQMLLPMDAFLTSVSILLKVVRIRLFLGIPSSIVRQGEAAKDRSEGHWGILAFDKGNVDSQSSPICFRAELTSRYVSSAELLRVYGRPERGGAVTGNNRRYAVYQLVPTGYDHLRPRADTGDSSSQPAWCWNPVRLVDARHL